MKKTLIALLLLAIAVPCTASTRLMKLTENRYLLTHQKHTNFGGQGKALRMTYEKAGSLCVVLGYSWFEIVNTESKGRTWGSGAAATVEIKLHREGDPENDGLLDCEELASEEQEEKMRKELADLEREGGS